MVEHQGLWEALKRRRVLRVLGLYLVGSWLLLQVADVLGEIWEVSAEAQQGLFLLLALALPVVIALAWIYDISDGGVGITRGTGFRELIARQGIVGRVDLFRVLKLGAR